MRFEEADGEEERGVGVSGGGLEAGDGFGGELAVAVGVIGDVGGFPCCAAWVFGAEFGNGACGFAGFVGDLTFGEEVGGGGAFEEGGGP